MTSAGLGALILAASAAAVSPAAPIEWTDVVAGYAAVMETVFAHAQDLRLTENHIRQLHRDLLQHSTKDERHRGEYKTLRNDVIAFAAFSTSSS